MTSAVVTLVEPLVDTRTAAAPPPRKRRRRTGAGGASDDCFACSKRAVKCDRKRPYCTQCIEIGKDCSGYKTTLTWGVGVASRGKLRGLSCPIARKNADGSDVVPEKAARHRKASVSKLKKEDAAETSAAGALAGQLAFSAPSSATSQRQLPPPTLPIPIPQAHSAWQIPSFNDHMLSRQNTNPRHGNFQLPPLQRIQTSLGSRYDLPGIPASGLSVGSYAETEFHSPMEYPHTPGSIGFPEHMQRNPFADQPMTASSTDSYSMSGTSMESYDHMSSSAESAQHGHLFMESGTMNPSQAELDTTDAMLFSSSEMDFDTFGPFGNPTQEDADDEQISSSLIDTRFSNPFFHLSPRLQSLMEYYETCICPFLVAFDGAQNPYRRHILQLAANNEGLQSAIAALAVNNIRMRKKEAHRIGFIEEFTDGMDVTDAAKAAEVPPEESMYKQMSIDHLNLQLTDVRAAQDDSVLATLLILCLFHVCDSGFSKFKTQLAGVQKLLSLRNPSIQSDFTGWVEMFFTWFDVMTSTVNDREMQIKGESLDMLDFSANLGALEQFSGCDGRLFKLIARLGRLNLLAQGRPVRSNSGLEHTPRMSAAKRPRTRAGRKKRPMAKIRANKTLTALDYDNIDGNGWGTPIISSDEDADGSADENAPVPDERQEFWEEWTEVRTRLQAWQMDPSPAPAANDSTQHDAGQRDLVHINESFRFSALLYTERLSNPCLPSSHQQFQQLVSQALCHITALPVTSCVNKFLLWPLFITGTECVDEGHRNIIRTRCIEIQRESGFFNNISGLEVLEKVWREVGSNVQGHEGEEVNARRRDSEAGRRGHGPRYGQAFRWRRAMDRADGEYIVI
ncbi:hypothetical protein LTR36_010579 [Oleoguttula mirabilis]|uniref:Zn(2)-C6 fungal-type domain-containing protein n=1 Tax=Oleoguttula mirabilis TaxID=1507867 RepID=A0AAV9JTG0_9PEZI|nr:hypothetical protein LTR36_010579 [Oleoguttula mirabilis]